MLVVGLTGGIASGKSTVSKLLSSPPHNIPIIDADVIARQILDPGEPAYAKVLAHFGPSILLPNSSAIDRSALGQRIFSSPADRAVLNSITHPAVRRAMARAVLRCWWRGEKVVVMDVPLLVETGLWKWVAKTVVVYVSEPIQIARLLARPPIPPNPALSREDAMSRINSQLPLSQKLPYADHIIDNSGTPSDLSHTVTQLVRTWLRASSSFPSWRLCWLCPPVGLLAALWALWGRGARVERRKRDRRGRGENGRVQGGGEGEVIPLKVMRGDDDGGGGRARPRL